MNATFGSDRRCSSDWTGFIASSVVSAPAVAIVTGWPRTWTVRPSAKAEHRLEAVGDAVDGPDRDGLGGRRRMGLGDRRLGPLDVAAAGLGDRADVGDGVVADLVTERARDVLALAADR